MDDDTFDAGTRSALTTPGEFALTGYAQHETARGGIAWSGTLTRNGIPVATVSEEGNGGCLTWGWHTPEGPTPAAVRAAFRAEAETHYGPAGEGYTEIDDWYAGDLATLADFAAQDAVICIADSLDWASGEYAAYPSTVPVADVAAMLTRPGSQFADHNPHILDPATGRFRPAADLT